MTRDELLERGDETVTIKQIVERFEAVEKEYKGKPWTLKQIYTQIDMLVSKEPCGDCISREKALQIIRAWFDREATPSDLKNEIEQLPSVTPMPKMGKWLNGELIPNDITGHYHAECSVCGKVRIVDNFCPNCGSKNIDD